MEFYSTYINDFAGGPILTSWMHVIINRKFLLHTKLKTSFPTQVESPQSDYLEESCAEIIRSFSDLIPTRNSIFELSIFLKIFPTAKGYRQHSSSTLTPQLASLSQALNFTPFEGKKFEQFGMEKVYMWLIF